MIKLIIFDFDGVIITGSNEGYFACYHKALQDAGVELNPQEERKRILAYWGKGYKKQLELLLKEHPDLLGKAISAYEYFYYQTTTFTKNIKLIKGGRQTLKTLSQKYKLAIASGMMKKTMTDLIKKFDLPFFGKIITSDEIKKDRNKKPAPYMINAILKYYSLSKEEAVYVGDMQNDVVMARSAGVMPIVVLSGNLTRKDAEKLSVKTVIRDINQLTNLSL